MNKRNAGVIVLAAILMAAGFLGVLFIGQVVNPPTVAIAVAVVDVPAGTTLTREMIAVDSVQMNGKVIAALVRESELEQFIGGTVVEPLHVYQPVPKAAISADGNPAAANRLALGLSDPRLVAMVVPVTPGTAPDAIVEGDYVDLNFGTAAPSSFGAVLSTSPTQSPLAGAFSPFSEPTLPPPDTEAPPATQTAEPLLMMPVAKTVVRGARVLAVIREERTATVQAEGEVSPRTVTVKGKAIALVVAIPREAQELLQFAIDNGTVRVALLSAQLERAEGAPPTLGMTWNDLVALVRMEREAALAQGLPAEVFGPGAFAVEATRAAQAMPTASAPPASPTASPPASPTPTP